LGFGVELHVSSGDIGLPSTAVHTWIRQVFEDSFTLILDFLGPDVKGFECLQVFIDLG